MKTSALTGLTEEEQKAKDRLKRDRAQGLFTGAVDTIGSFVDPTNPLTYLGIPGRTAKGLFAATGAMMPEEAEAAWTKWYHGASNVLDLANKGKVTGGEASKAGTWLTNNPSLASRYAQQAGKQFNFDARAFEDFVYSPAFDRFKRQGGFIKGNSPEEALKNLKESGVNAYYLEQFKPVVDQYFILQRAQKLGEAVKAGATVYPVGTKTDDLMSVNIKGKQLTEDEKLKAIEKAKKQGKRGVVFKNAKDDPLVDPSADPSDVAVVFDEADIEFLDSILKNNLLK